MGAVERLLEQLDLEQGETSEATTVWHGDPGGALNLSNRLFGGLVVAQTIVAAGRTHPERDVHSVHQVFLRAGTGDEPLTYRVERLFTGRTYASVRVEVVQSDHLISHAQVGVTAGIEGPDRQDDAPVISPPGQMVNRDEYRERLGWQDMPVEMFFDPASEGDRQPTFKTWIRPRGAMSSDPLMNKAVLGYASDRALMSVAWRPHGPGTSFKGSTLDHSIWFHRPAMFDGWHSYVMHSPTISGGRGMGQGTIHQADGTLVATTMQQGTFRPITT